MGNLYTYCAPSEEHDKKIEELETLLKEQAKDKEELKHKLEREKQRQKKYRNKMRGRDDNQRVKEKIEQISNEKKQVFKTMLKERKNVSKLEDQIEDYKKTIKGMEHQMKTLAYEQEKARSRADEEKHSRMSMISVKSEPAPRSRPSTTSRPSGVNVFGISHVLEGITIPRVHIPGIGTPDSTKEKELPFRVKTPTIRDDNASDILSPDDMSSHEGSSSSSEYPDDSKISTADTMILDQDYDAVSEATHVYSWLHGNTKNKRDIKQLKHRLASLLTSRSEGYRQRLIEEYREQYGKHLEKDIKKLISKGHALQIIHGLLMTRAQFDAELIHECLIDWDIRPVADVICGRKVQQLREIDAAYKKKYKFNMKKHLQALARRDQKRILTKMLGRILDYKRKEDSYVDLSEVNRDLNMIFTTKIFKHEKKEKLVLIFSDNSVQYIRVLNERFLLKSRDSLQVFLEKKLGPRSMTGWFCKCRVRYALDTPDFYATKINDLGNSFRRNQKKISDIFIQRMEIDLDLIQRAWKMNKYGDGKDLKKWIATKTSGSNSGYFLLKILNNCGT
eukprot:691709_1